MKKRKENKLYKQNYYIRVSEPELWVGPAISFGGFCEPVLKRSICLLFRGIVK